MPEAFKIDYTDVAQVYGLHRELAGAATSSMQEANGAHDVRAMGELAEPVEMRDIAEWDVESREGQDDPHIQDDLDELAKYATGLHGVAGIIKRAKANTAAGILDMSNVLAAAALEQHGGAWYDEALAEHRARGFDE